MAVQRYTGQVPDTVTVAVARTLAKFMPIPGTLVSVELAVHIANGGGDTVFDVLKNGVSIYGSPTDRPKIASGAISVTQVPPVTAVAFGNTIEIVLVSWPVGGLVGPATVGIGVDDGVTVGGSVEIAEADTVPDIVALTKLIVGNGDLTDMGSGVGRLLTAADAFAAVMTALLTGGLLKPSLLPPLAITDTFTVGSQAAMLALAAQQGDVAIRSDLSPTQAFILAAADPTVLANWVALPEPTVPANYPMGGDATGTTDAMALALLLAASGSSNAAGTYGDASHIPQVTVDRKGRITAIQAIAASAALAILGDVTGTLAASVVAALRGVGIKDFGASGTVRDDFDDNVFDTTLWQRSSTVNVAEANQRLEIYTGGATDWFQWVNTMDMTNRYAGMKVGPGNAGQIWIRLLLNTGVDYVEFRVNMGGASLKAGYHINGSGDFWVYDGAYSSTTHKYLRFQHQTSDGRWHFFASPDGTAGSWVDIGNCAPPSGAGQSTSRLVAYGFTASSGLAGYIDEFVTSIPLGNVALAEGQVLVYHGTQFENFPVGMVQYLDNLVAGSPAPTKLLPGWGTIRFDRVNHRLGVWNDNISAWDWKSFNNA